MSKLFSERMGYTPPKPLQLESMDEDLRNSLWNSVIRYFDALNDVGDKDFVGGLLLEIWEHYLKKTKDSFISSNYKQQVYEANKAFRKHFFSSDWHYAYSAIEVLLLYDLSSLVHSYSEIYQQLHDDVNLTLEKENSGYRLIAGKFAPITNPTEIGTIEEALSFTALGGVNEHLTKALSLFADREKPDYANSIKEAISAIESFVQVSTNDGKVTLGKGLKKLEIHKAKIKAFEALYGYTSDEKGIRHANFTDAVEVSKSDAKFMLVTLNYLVEKCQEKDVEIEGLTA